MKYNNDALAKRYPQWNTIIEQQKGIIPSEIQWWNSNRVILSEIYQMKQHEISVEYNYKVKTDHPQWNSKVKQKLCVILSEIQTSTKNKDIVTIASIN